MTAHPRQNVLQRVMMVWIQLTLCFNIKPRFQPFEKCGHLFESYSKSSGQVLLLGLHLQSQRATCCVIVHPALCCCTFSLCVMFYVLVVSVVATPDLFYFGATPKASRRNMSLILRTEESFVNHLQFKLARSSRGSPEAPAHMAASA